MTTDFDGNYGWTSSQGPESCGYVTPRVLEIVKTLGVRRVLDLGSGNGALCARLSSAGYEAVGVEYDQQGVRIASAAYPYIRFHNFGVQDDPAKLLLHEMPFDAVVSTEVIEHLYVPHRLAIYARYCLRDAGYLILSTPYHGYLKNLALSVLNKWDSHHTALWHGGHIKFWSRATLTQLLVANGFSVIGFSGVGRVPYLWKSMVVVAQKAT